MEVMIPWALCSFGVMIGYAVKVEDPTMGIVIMAISTIMWVLFVIAMIRLS